MRATRLTTLYYRAAPGAPWCLCGSFEHPAAVRAAVESVVEQGAEPVAFDWWDSEAYPVVLPQYVPTLAELERHFGHRRPSKIAMGAAAAR
jgi:hypothetical protein